MGALTKDVGGSVRIVDKDKRPLAANAVVYKRSLAVCIGGYYKAATGAAGEVLVGEFTGKVDNTAGANGAKSATIKFFRTRVLRLVANDGGAPVVVANRESLCSLLDDATATLYSDAKGAPAIVYDVDATEGVWVESPAALATPLRQTGTTTLVAGTKTVTGVVLTANSRILLSMKDPGAGAITAFAALDAPAANRNVGAGTFVINAIDNAKATIATAVCTVDYEIIG